VRFWRFSLPRGIASIFETTLGWLDILLIGAFRSAQEVGIYAAVNRTTIMALFATRAASMAIGPRLSALLSLDRRSDAQSLYQVMTWWLIAFTWPIYITLAIFSSLLLQVFGPAFADGAQALTILSVAMLVNIATGNVNLVLLMAGRSSWNLANSAVSLALNVGLNLILIPKYGIDGAAVAWAASIVLWNVAAVVEVKFLLGLDPFGGGHVFASGAALVCFGATGLTALKLFGATPAGLLVHLAVSGASYAVVLYRARDVLHVEVLREAVALRRRSRS
jgi:O-antigen/teichoic acid export membrane protein